jgi:hypothetical protein
MKSKDVHVNFVLCAWGINMFARRSMDVLCHKIPTAINHKSIFLQVDSSGNEK